MKLFSENFSLSDNRQSYLKDVYPKSFTFCAAFSVIVFVTESVLSRNLQVANSAAKLLIIAICLQALIFSIGRKFNSLIAGILTAFGLVALASLGVLSHAFVYFGWMGLGAGVYFFCRFCFIHMSGFKRSMLTAFICYPLCWFCEWVVTSFNILARVSRGHVVEDTLFHASIAGMLKTHVVASTGISGLVPIKYHFFSHILFAGLSNLSGVPVLEVYGIAPLLIFAPIFLSFAGAYGVTLFRQSVGLHLSTVTFTFLLCVVPVWGRGWAIWLYWLGSESNLVALCLLYAVLYDSNIVVVRSLYSSILMSIMAFTITAFATLSKGPIGVVIFIVHALMVPKSASVFRLAMALCSIGGLITVLPFVAGDSGMQVKPLSFFVEHVRGGNHTRNLVSGVTLSPEVLGISVLVLIAGVLAHFCVPTFALFVYTNVKGKLRSSLVAKVIVSTLVFGAIAVLAMHVNGGSMAYFSSISSFVALPFISTWLVSNLINRKAVLFAFVTAFLLFAISAYRQRLLLWTTFVTKCEGGVSNPLVEKLVQVRKSPNLQSHRIVSGSNDANTLIDNCRGRPFLYPAVSERPWFGLIENNGPCNNYTDFGYRDYKSIIDKSR
jgi:hypothetical protein